MRAHNPLFSLRMKGPETSLVVRCFRLGVAITGLSVPSLVRDLRSHTPHGTAKKKKKHTEKRLLHGLSWHYFYFLFITFNLRKILKYS